MITKMQLSNWRSHLDTTLDFTQGTNCFIGKMGAGKTSILDAICFALFGTFPTLQSKKIKLRDVVMKKPKKKDEASVNLSFVIDGSEWNVKRTISSGRTTAELRKHGKLVESPQSTKVTDEIERVLKINYDLFTRAIYSEQNQIDMFLTIPKGQRMKKIDQLLAIDKFEKARLSTKALINKCNLSVVDRQQIIEDLKKDESIRNLNELRREVNRFEDENKMLERMYKEETQKRNMYEEQISTLKEQQKNLRMIEEKINLDTALINSAKVDIERLKEDLFSVAEFTIDDLKLKFDETEEQYLALRDDLSKEESNFDRLKQVMMQKEAKIETIEHDKLPDIDEKVKEKRRLKSLLRKAKIKDLEKQLKEREKEFTEYQKEFQTAIAKIEEIKASVKEISSVKGSCPICDNKLPDAKKKSIIQKKKKRISKLNDQNKKIDSKLKKVNKVIEKLKDDINSMAHVKTKLEVLEDVEKEQTFLRDALKQIKDEMKLHNSEKIMLEKTISLSKKKVDELKTETERLKSLFDKRMLVDEKLKMIQDLQDQIDSFNKEKMKYSTISVDRIDALEKELQSIIAKQSEIKTNFENMGMLITEKRKRLVEIESKIRLLDEYSSDIRRIEAVSDQMKLLETSLLSTQEQLRKNFVTTVNQAMQTLWTDIYPYEDIYDIRISIDNGDYVLQLQDSSGWMNADGAASGGERSIACLALRIAFALVLAPQLRWLVLDEPTANLDSKAVEDLSTVLRDKVSEFVDQIFLITHDTALETAVSGYLYKIDREKEKDGYTKAFCVSKPEGL